MQNTQPPMLSGAQHSGIKMVSHSPNLNRRRLQGAAALEQMADDFRVFAANAGSVDRDCLRALGWSETQIDLHGRKAADRARDLAEVERSHSERRRRRVQQQLREDDAQRCLPPGLRVRLSPAQRRLMDALRLYGSLHHVRGGWAIPGTLQTQATTRTVNAMIAAGFCARNNFTTLAPTREGRALLAQLDVVPC